MITQSENVLEFDNSLDLYYFDTPSNDHNHFGPDYTLTVDVIQPIPGVTKMMSITKFNSSGTTGQWLCILEKELPK